MTNEKEPVAKAVFAAQIAMGLAEERVMELLDATLGESDDAWSEFTVDHYDQSIEVYGAKAPTDEALDALAIAGFGQVWFHEHHRERERRCECPLHYLRNREPRR